MPGAVEEVLRWVTPLNNFFRRAVADDTIGGAGGQPIERGDRLLLLYPSANRDEAVFDDPFRFDIRRSPNPHLVVRVRHPPVHRRQLRPDDAGRRRSAASPAGPPTCRAVTEPDVEPNIFARAVRRFDLALRPAEPEG